MWHEFMHYSCIINMLNAVPNLVAPLANDKMKFSVLNPYISEYYIIELFKIIVRSAFNTVNTLDYYFKLIIFTDIIIFFTNSIHFSCLIAPDSASQLVTGAGLLKVQVLVTGDWHIIQRGNIYSLWSV